MDVCRTVWWMLLCGGVLGMAQPRPDVLPAPTGAFATGRVTLLYEDSSRIEPLAWNATPRRIMFDVWYPVERSSPAAPAAPYLNLDAFERALGAERVRKEIGAAYDLMKAGRPVMHTVSQGAFAKTIRRAPLLLFSPGGGMIRELYAAQLEELASHGYIVAAITHTYDGLLTVFPDGSSAVHNGKRWPSVPSFEGEANLNQLEWHTADMLAVLNYLIGLNGAASAQLPFAGHVDAKRIGAFGHSFGGVAAAHACQKDPRISACLNQDGAMGMKPFYLDAQGWGMDQAFLLMERPPNREPLSDRDLSEMKLTRARATEFIAQLNGHRDRILRSTGRGSYRVLLRREVTTHIDFSDVPLLTATSAAARDQRLRVMEVVRRYTLAFFDRHVKGVRAKLLDGEPASDIVESIERFGPARRPR